jgi:Tfp pilus assembly protein PilF
LTGVPRTGATVAAAAAAVAVFFTAAALADTTPRWRPASEQVVLVLPDTMARLPADARVAPSPLRDAERAESLAALARQSQDARWFGRAEAVVEPWVARPDAPPRILVVAADLAQQRHDFTVARGFLDRALAVEADNPGARLQRANVELLLGDFAAARADCRAVFAAGDAFAGTVCLASATTGRGSVGRGRQLMAALDRQGEVPAALARWQLLTAADLAARDGDSKAALDYLSRAHALDPVQQETRARLAEALITRGESRAALDLAAGENVSAALLVARLRAASRIDAASALAARRELDTLLEVGRLRGTNSHRREAAELALYVDGDARRALALARENFAVQKDTPDLRLLVSAAMAAGDGATIRSLRDWLAETGFEDRVVAAQLAKAGP